MPEVCGPKKHILLMYFPHPKTALTPSYSHFSLLILLLQLIVKVDTKVRRKSHLRAALLIPDFYLFYFSFVLCFVLYCSVLCCAVLVSIPKKKYIFIDILFVRPVSVPQLLPVLLPLDRMACKCRKLCDY